LCQGTDAIREVPPDRWDVNEFFDPNPDAPGKMSTRWAGFLEEIDGFDADFFGISPREAVTMDPQQRLFLEVSWEALDNAGQSPEKLLGSSTGVFVGIASNDYAQLQMQFGDLAEIGPYFATGTCHSVASGRLSYTLGLHGPSIAVDTACSSSLVAVHLACQSLRLGESRMALAGGVNVILAPELLINFSKSHMMAADGRCKTFDASADGFVRGEGCGVVVLKRLAEAIADGDNVLAVIRGTAINQDGRSSGLTVPNGSAQQEVIRRALINAGVDPTEVGYVETHGTGTSLGDPIEVHALHAVYGAGRSKQDSLALGSIKSNIGHLETAAGVAGLIKAVLVLMHGEIPPQLHFKDPNPHIAWNEMAVCVPVVRTPWPPSSARRIAALSSFGFSGTNVHMVIESAATALDLASPKSPDSLADEMDDRQCATVDGRQERQHGALEERSHHLLTVSAKSAGALQELVGRYARYLGEHPDVALADVCHTANTGRSHFEHRLSAVAASVEQLRQDLSACAEGQEPVGVFRGHADLTRRPEVVFLFTGQGGQYVNMGRTLYESEAVFREVVDRCDELLRGHLEKPLREVLYPRHGEATLLDQTQYTHVAMFAVQYGLAQLWRSWGVEPGAVMGHSVGEIVASAVSGMVSLEDGLMLMRERGRLMQSLPPTGLMASLLAGEEQVRSVLERYRDRVAIAAINGPASTVISGERRAVEEVLGKLEGEGVKTRVLKVSNSFHSPLVEPVLEEFEQAARRARYRTPEVAQFSSMRLEWVEEGKLLDAAYWPYNLRHTVRFSEAIGALYGQGYRVFVEIGPTPILAGMGSQCVPPGEGVWLPSLRQDRNDWEQMLEDVATLYVKGVNIEWREFERCHPHRKIMLPAYPWQRKPYRVEAARTRQRGFTSPESSRWQNAVTAARTQSLHVPIDLNLGSYPAKWQALDRITTALMTRTLFELGAFRTPHQTHSVESSLRDLGIRPTYRTLIARWLQKLAAAGVLQQEGSSYSRREPLSGDPLTPVPGLADPSLSDIPFVLEYVSRCGQMAAAILTGEASALDTLFPGGSLILAEHIYEHWALSRYFNDIARSVVESLVRTLPHGRQLRIAEIGAGTGGATSALLPVLPANRTQYCFTDASKFFFDRARDKYKQYPFLRFGLLDIENKPADQGFGEHTFDAIVASNVLHATRNLDETIENVLSLMGPAALLILCEVTRPPSWIEFSYGFMEDWQRFNDGLRKDSPLLSRKDWEKVLRSHGFEDVAVFPEHGSPAEILGEHCIVARAPSSARPVRSEQLDSWMDDSGQPSMAAAEIQPAQAAKGRGESFLNALRYASAGEQREQLVELVRSRTMKVLRRDPSDLIDRRHRLMDLGIDSLMAVELRNALSSELGLPRALPATLIFDYPSVEAIAGYLASRVLILDPVSPENRPGEGRPEAMEFQPAALRIEDLSDEETEQLLLKKLETM
jgi:acyl transferase domain-containing protein/acyl carrier protein/trans-aconitate methyltransferase